MCWVERYSIQIDAAALASAHINRLHRKRTLIIKI
jgi:hypothetical protein